MTWMGTSTSAICSRTVEKVWADRESPPRSVKAVSARISEDGQPRVIWAAVSTAWRGVTCEPAALSAATWPARPVAMSAYSCSSRGP